MRFYIESVFREWLGIIWIPQEKTLFLRITTWQPCLSFHLEGLELWKHFPNTWCDRTGDAVGSPQKGWLWVITSGSCGISKTLGHRSTPGILSLFYSYCTQPNTFQQHPIPLPPNHSRARLAWELGSQGPGVEGHNSLSELSGRLGNVPKNQTRQGSREKLYLLCSDHLQIWIPLKHTDCKYSPGKINNMSSGNNINGFTWNSICLFLNTLIHFFFF